MTSYVNKLSDGEAVGRDTCRRMFRKLPVVTAAYRSGGFGAVHVMLLGRVRESPSERNQRNRTANLNQDPFELEWAKAKARVGDGVYMADLCRTPAQRRSNVWVQMAANAATNKDGMAPSEITQP